MATLDSLQLTVEVAEAMKGTELIALHMTAVYAAATWAEARKHYGKGPEAKAECGRAADASRAATAAVISALRAVGTAVVVRTFQGPMVFSILREEDSDGCIHEDEYTVTPATIL